RYVADAQASLRIRPVGEAGARDRKARRLRAAPGFVRGEELLRRDGLVVDERVEQVAVRCRELRIERDGASQRRDGVREASRFLEQDAEIAERMRQMRCELMRAPIARLGLVVSSHLLEHDAEIVMAVDQPGLEREATPVARLRLGSAAERRQDDAQIE